MLQSKYKTLLVSGCSFTHNNCDGHFAWANDLAHWAGMRIVNLAIPGAGNTHIANSIMLYIEQHQLVPAETLVMAMWSGPARIDWITDQSLSKFKDSYPFTYNYDNHNELVLGGSWWQPKRRSHVENTLVEYSKYQSAHSFALHSWLAMSNLSNYLTVKGFEFYYSSITDIENSEELWIDYANTLAELNLSLDKTKWLLPCIGNYSKELGLLQDDNFHPTMQGHESWTKHVLIPYLIERNVLHDE